MAYRQANQRHHVQLFAGIENLNQPILGAAAQCFLQKQIEPYLPGGAARFAPSYDTYRIDGLPAGPICSPGLAAIRAALAPADVDYLYFCNDAEANYYYAVTYEEHLANIEKAGLRSPDGTGVS